MTDSTNPGRVLKYLLYGLGMHGLGIVMAVIFTIIFGVFISGGDSIASLGLGILGALIGYFIGMIAGLVFIKRILGRNGSVLLGSIAVVLWIGIGWLGGLGLAEINLTPYISLVFFIITLPYVAIGAYCLKKEVSLSAT